MKILKYGPVKTAIVICEACASELQITPFDCTKISSNSTYNQYAIICPVCQKHQLLNYDSAFNELNLPSVGGI